MIYVEFRGRADRRGWWARCDDCSWTSGPHATQEQANQAADEHGESSHDLGPRRRWL